MGLLNFSEERKKIQNKKILNAGQMNWRVNNRINASCINLLLE